MANKIRLGFVGANIRSPWASQSHFPALLASPDVELTAVCNARDLSLSGRWGTRDRWQNRARAMGARLCAQAVSKRSRASLARGLRGRWD